MVASFKPLDPNYSARVRADFDRQGLMALLGATLVKIEPGFCEIHLPFRSEVSQQHGFFHAGASAAIADTAGGYAGFTLMPADSAILTVEFKLNLIEKAEGELLIARGSVLRTGRKLTVCQLEVTCTKEDEGVLCAVGLQTIYCASAIPRLA